MTIAILPPSRSGVLDDGALRRFIAKIRVDASGCWLWTASTKSSGYGQFVVRASSGRPETAHRVAYRAFVDDIPAGFVVRHRCDVKLCVRPDHLDIGTPADNSRDYWERQAPPRTASPLGALLTAARGRRTLADVVAPTSIGAPMLSRAERGDTGLSLLALDSLLDSLGVDDDTRCEAEWLWLQQQRCVPGHVPSRNMRLATPTESAA